MGLLERAHAAWIELQGVSRLFGALPALNPLGHWSAARLLQDVAERAPDDVGLAYGATRWTWLELLRGANRYARFAVQEHLQRGDVVALLMDSRPEYLMSTSGFNRAGVVSALINTHLSGAALAHAVKAARPKAVLAGSEHAGRAREALASFPHLANAGRVWVDTDAGSADGSDGMRVISPEVAACSDHEVRRDLPRTLDPMCYIYTSGTTGLPKAAVISNQRWLEAAFVFSRLVGEMTAADVLYLTLPLYHSAGFLAAWGAVVASGATLALRRKFSASQFWDDVRTFDATVIIYIGELFRYLLSQPRRTDERRHHVRLCMGNGLRAEVWKKFQSRFHIPLIREYYGATEGNLGLVNLEGRPGMIGRLLPGMAIVRCDPLTGAVSRNREGHCESVTEGEHGLLLGRINALTTFEGYRDRAATRRKIVHDVFARGDTYFNTGDLVQLNADGWVSFVDRVGDTFRWKGENVSTQEVAEVLAGARGVQEANVYGVQVNGAEGRAGMATLVVDPGFTLDGFARYVTEHLASYQRPYFLRLVNDMRVTGTFKHCKLDYRADGFDPAVVKDPLFFLDGQRYVPIDASLYRRLETHQVTLH